MEELNFRHLYGVDSVSKVRHSLGAYDVEDDCTSSGLSP